MAAEQQLERSVLERKEREELRAIAQAMSLDTNSRSKKADIIDQILRAAGVEVSAGSANGGPGAPTRARSGARNAASNGDSETAEHDDESFGGPGEHENANGSSRPSSSSSPTSLSSDSSDQIEVESPSDPSSSDEPS